MSVDAITPWKIILTSVAYLIKTMVGTCVCSITWPDHLFLVMQDQHISISTMEIIWGSPIAGEELMYHCELN